LRTEYESIQLAALLHDIGKFLQRGTDIREKHSALSAVFVENYSKCFEDPHLIKEIVSHHHEGRGTAPEDMPDAIPDPRVRMLAYLVCRADNFASSERPESSFVGGYKARVALDCVFSNINIGLGTPPPPSRYPLLPLYSGKAFPSPKLTSEHPMKHYETHLENFESDFDTCFVKPYKGMADTMLSLLQKYLWCIPSDTTKEPRDVSLADHMKATCAIASCMYKYHEENGWHEESVKDDDLVRLKLVCGDISGIQNYIYEITKTGTSDVAKRLRARSFRISLLTEAIALNFLKALDLPQACKIMAAGGQFYILAPNTQTTNETLRKQRNLISKWLLDNFMGELAISVADTEVAPDELKQGRFDQALRRIRCLTAESKLRKFEDAITRSEVVFEMNYEGRGACSCCDRRPAKQSSDLCDVCKQDEALGRELVSRTNDGLWLEILDSPGGNISLPGGWSAKVITTKPTAQANTVHFYNLTSSKLLTGTPCGFFPYAGYVPRWSPEEYELLSDERKKEEPDIENVRRGTAVKSFSDLAEASDGAPLLGILKADVDHLGLIFTLGTKGTASISRIATLSSFLQDFFAFELISIVKEHFPNTYVVYSGGDDLMLVGPWTDLIQLAYKIRTEFAEFTGQNPNITLSAGIGTFRRTSPISLTSRITSNILEQSKSGGRDSLTVFGTTVKWSAFESINNWMTCLYEAAVGEETEDNEEKNNKKLSSSFLYRLLGYQNLAMRYFEGGDDLPARAAMFRPYLAYDIARNLDPEKLKDKPHLLRLRERLIRLIEGGKEDWQPLGPALTWCLYRLRKEDK